VTGRIDQRIEHIISTGGWPAPDWAGKHKVSPPQEYDYLRRSRHHGICLPAAIGAKLAKPDYLVVDIEATFLHMTIAELATAAQHNIGVKSAALQ